MFSFETGLRSFFIPFANENARRNDIVEGLVRYNWPVPDKIDSIFHLKEWKPHLRRVVPAHWSFYFHYDTAPQLIPQVKRAIENGQDVRMYTHGQMGDYFVVKKNTSRTAGNLNNTYTIKIGADAPPPTPLCYHPVGFVPSSSKLGSVKASTILSRRAAAITNAGLKVTQRWADNTVDFPNRIAKAPSAESIEGEVIIIEETSHMYGTAFTDNQSVNVNMDMYRAYVEDRMGTWSRNASARHTPAPVSTIQEVRDRANNMMQRWGISNPDANQLISTIEDAQTN